MWSLVALALMPTVLSAASPEDIAARGRELLAAYAAADAEFRGGWGYSDGKSSGTLAWAEANFLRRYMKAYYASRDPYWLGKIAMHFDRMIQSLADPDGDGFLAWRDIVYSVGRGKIVEAAAPEGLTLTPPEQAIWYRNGGKDVTGHKYRIEFVAPTRIRVTDLTAAKTIAELDYSGRLTITQIPGLKFRLSGPGKKGARWTVETMAPQYCEFQVHDGMVTYPIAEFIEAVYSDPALRERFGAKADRYAKLIHDHFLLKWGKTWREFDDGTGLYCFTKNPTQRYPGFSLPHNQYLALARTWLVMQALPGVADRALYRDRAEKMARFFKRHLRLNDGAYVWHYWDPLPGENANRYIEDYSHATIDISFVIEARDRGIVFTDDDMRRFASTWVDVMWNGDLAKPRFGRRVDTNEGDKLAWWEWMQLGRFDPRALRLAVAVFEAAGERPTMAPEVLCLLARCGYKIN